MNTLPSIRRPLFWLGTVGLLIGIHLSQGSRATESNPPPTATPVTGAMLDRTLPFTIEADSVTYSDVTQTSVFSGRVILTQGSMKITADKVETVVDPEGYQYATATGAVSFTQQRAGTDETLNARAEQLLYDGKTNLISLAGKRTPASITRTNAKGSIIDQITGADLTYNQITEVFTSNAERRGRTHVYIAPKTNPPIHSTQAPRKP